MKAQIILSAIIIVLVITGMIIRRPVIILHQDPDVSACLTGTWDLRNQNQTLIQIINPTSTVLQVVVVFLDDDEKYLGCYREKELTQADLMTVDVRQYVKENELGVVFAFAIDPETKNLVPGIVGYQLKQLEIIQMQTGLPSSSTESVLHPIPSKYWDAHRKYIMDKCNQ